jgi:hypothetical protein
MAITAPTDLLVSRLTPFHITPQWNRTGFVHPYPAIYDMSIDHGRSDIPMTEQLLHRSDVIAIRKKMRGKRVPKGMTRCRLDQTRLLNRFSHSLLQYRCIHCDDALAHLSDGSANALPGERPTANSIPWRHSGICATVHRAIPPDPNRRADPSHGPPSPTVSAVSDLPPASQAASLPGHKSALRAWFCVEELTFFSTARWLRNALISGSAISAG